MTIILFTFVISEFGKCINDYIPLRSLFGSGVTEKMTTTQKTMGYVLATVLMAILLGSALAAPTFSAYADKPKSDPPKSTHTDADDDHKKGKKDPDGDKDKDNKKCKHDDTHKNGKYRHDCDSDHDFK